MDAAAAATRRGRDAAPRPCGGPCRPGPAARGGVGVPATKREDGGAPADASGGGGTMPPVRREGEQESRMPLPTRLQGMRRGEPGGQMMGPGRDDAGTDQLSGGPGVAASRSGPATCPACGATLRGRDATPLTSGSRRPAFTRGGKAGQRQKRGGVFWEYAGGAGGGGLVGSADDDLPSTRGGRAAWACGLVVGSAVGESVVFCRRPGADLRGMSSSGKAIVVFCRPPGEGDIALGGRSRALSWVAEGNR